LATVKEKFMKATLIALSVSAALSLSGITLAKETVESPVMLTDIEMDTVVAGESQPPGWCEDGFPGATNGNNPYGPEYPPGWGPEGFPGGPNR
jgi:hypothetical protein